MVRKKFLHDFNYNYMEEVYFPTIRQRWFLLHTDPVWYRFILGGIVLEAMIILYMTPFQLQMFSHYHMFFTRIQQIFNFIYTCDILLTFYQKFFFKYRYPYPNPIRRPAPVMLMEIASVIPFELIYANKAEYTNNDKKFYLVLITLHIFKVPRFLCHVHNNRRELHGELKTRILEMIVILLIFTGFLVHALHLSSYLVTPADIFDAFQIITCNMAGRGAILTDTRNKPRNIYEFEIATTFLAIFMWTIAIYPTVCFMILSFIENQQHRFNYSHLIHLFKTKISEKYTLSGKKYQKMMDYFEANWKLRGGFSRKQFKTAQRSLRIEISMDTFWPAFKHSMLFRHTEFYILRALADKFEHRIRMEGEYIFTKNKNKLGLIYIVQGSIDVLSNENNESGILSLTAGSCIGEAALIIPHVSPVNFRCTTVCELFELPRTKFLSLQKSYPLEFKQLQMKLFELFSTAYKINAYNSKFNQVDVEERRLIWLKHHLHNLMSHRAVYKYTHEQTNVYIRHELEDSVKKQKHISHMYECLDKLAIRERTFTDVDLVFIKNTCPWILKAASPITNIWEYLIVLLTIVCSLSVSYGFCIEYTETAYMISTTIHVLFAFDIVVQVITPVLPGSDARTLGAVLSERLRTTGFFLDIISVFYWRMIAFVLDTDLPWFELFKLIKVWRLFKFFQTWRDKFLLNMILFTIAVGFTIYIALIYSYSCLFALSKITDTMISPVTIQYATGAGLPFKTNDGKASFSYVYIIANGLSLMVQLGVTAMVCSAFYLKSVAKSKIVETIHTLSRWIDYKANDWLWVRLQAYFNVLRHENDVLLSQGNISRLFELPRYFEIIMKSNIHFRAIKELHIFKNLSEEFVTNLLVETEVFTCYQHSILVSRGIIYKDVFVLITGECRTLISGTYKPTTTYEPLNFLECCYNYPALTSIVALTDCLVLKFDFQTFLRLLYKTGEDYRIFQMTVNSLKKRMQKTGIKLLYAPEMIVRRRNKKPNFKRFLYFAPKNSYAEFDYHVPFDKIKPFNFVKFFLMRTTFYPEGTFIKCYEFIRCIVAFISAFAFTIPAMNVGAYSHSSQGYILMITLDLLAVVDIYVRMHVGYYTPDGILVSHPLSTAKYYMTHGFFVDFIAVFPFDFFPMKVQYRVALNAIHAFQLHRMAALRFYYSTYHRFFIMNVISMLSYILFTANLITTIIFVYDCYSWDTEEQFPAATCRTFNYDNSTVSTHFHILFLVISSLECSGVSGKIDVEDLDRILTIIICVLTIVGIVTQVLYKGYIFSSYITSLFEKYEYVVGVRRLMRLLSQGTVNSRYMRKEVSNYYDLHWSRVASQNMAFITKDMISALKRDMLLTFYGKNLVEYSAFTDSDLVSKRDVTNFIKNIFLEAKPMIIPKSGYGATINDIDQYCYFLNKGSVDVLDVDGAKLKELTAGSIYGNFSGEKYTRLKLSIVANVNTELVYISSTDFFKTLAYFPKICATFDKLIKKNVFYIEGTKAPEPHLRMSFDEYLKAVHKYSFFQFVKYVHLLYVCHLGVCVELYQLAVGEIHYIYLAVQYSMDLVHLLKEYMKFCMPYKDEHRIPIFNIKKIVARQLKNRTELLVMIITVIYLDLFLVVPILVFGRYQLKDFTYLFTTLRLNRLVRIYYIKAAYHNERQLISQTSSNITKWFYVMYWLIISYQAVAAATAILDSLTIGDTPNLIHNIPVEQIRNMRYLSSLEKFELYAKYLFFSNLIHINSNDPYYKPNNTMFNIYVIIIFMYRLIVDAVVLCSFFEAMIDIAALRRLYLKSSCYLRFYMAKSYGTFIVKDRVMDNAKHAWTKNYYKSDYILEIVCAKYIKEVIISDLYGYLLRRHPILSHTHLDFLRQLGFHLKKVIYPCNFVIVYKKEMRKCMFFLHKGAVAAYDVDFGYDDIALGVLRKGDSFGFIQGLGLSDAIFDYTYITLSHSEIIELDWDAWNYLLPFFPASKEYIFEGAENFAKVTSVRFLPTEVKKDYW